MKLAPKPTRMRPPQMKIVMFGDSAMTSSPAAHRAAPRRKLVRQPMMVPTRPPAAMKAPAISEYTMFASWMSGVVAPSTSTSCWLASPSAPLSPDVPICARINTIMGSTRNFSTPPSGCVVLLFAIMSSFNLGWNAYAEKGSLASSLRNSAALIVGRLLPFRT